MTFSDGTPSTVSEMLAAQRRIRGEGAFRVREHRGFGHGLSPGEDRDLNCPVCTREDQATRAVGRLGRWGTWGDESLRELLRMYDSGEIGLEDKVAASLRAEVTRRERCTPCTDCGGGYWQEYAGPPASCQYVPHASICPAVAS